MEPDEQFKYLLAEVKKAAGLRDMAQICERRGALSASPLGISRAGAEGWVDRQYAISDQPLTPEERNKQYAGTA